MFIILNKLKILSYFISLFAVIMVFSVGLFFDKNEETVTTYKSNLNIITFENETISEYY